VSGCTYTHDSLSPRRRVQLALDHQTTDRVPITLLCGEPDQPSREGLARHLGVDAGEGVDRYLEQYVDLIAIGPSFRAADPDYRGPALERTPKGGYQDVWGCHWDPISYGAASHSEISHYPLAAVQEIADLEKHRWPSPDWWDYPAIGERIAAVTAQREYALVIHSGNPFERTWWMRGYEQTFLDMIDRPELFHEIMARVTDFHLKTTRRTLAAAAGRVDLAFTADDLAGQTGLLISLPMWEKHIKPYHVRLNRAIHEFGVKVIYHSDGAVMEAIPGLMEAGIDVLQALQFSAHGMDAAVMKERYGDRLCFEGGVSVQTTLPFGSVADVQREVRHLIRTLGRNGGYILGPSHAIEAPTPPENIVAMFGEAAGYRPSKG